MSSTVELFSELWLFLKNMNCSGDIQRYLLKRRDC